MDTSNRNGTERLVIVLPEGTGEHVQTAYNGLYHNHHSPGSLENKNYGRVACGTYSGSRAGHVTLVSDMGGMAFQP